MSDTIPTFAVVGAVNHGKSSVVSTLAEDDQVRISAMAGETVECQRFAVQDLFVFYDTPGFQNALEALPELAAAARAREPLSVFREFVVRHRDNEDYRAECTLFRPLIEEGAGILYVVDGSEPVLELHAAEMEILRLTGQPRLAVINRTGRDDHVAEWKRRLGLHFNAVREFNAHRAGFADRVELLETLAGIEQTWKPKLGRAVALYREAWEDRLRECAEIVVELLVDALTHQEVAGAPPTNGMERDRVAEGLKARFTRNVGARELEAHRAMIRLFGHRRVRALTGEAPVYDADLFSADTWRAFGLTTRQLVGAGALGGAATGVGVDVLLAGHTLLAGAAIGGLAGAAGALVLGWRRPELKVTVPGLGQRVRLGGSALAVGPYGAINFPWILMDRAMGVFCYVIHRAHARRDEAVIDSGALKAALERAGLSSARWPDADRREAERHFGRIRRGRMGPEEREALRDLVTSRLVVAGTAPWRDGGAGGG
ncbi:MAG: DUF3482 domain-containing protein [Verrucomicrobiae bacterium]|nr:DUF3482 domain-containing protein [Verrucomicrobiae bacterium]